MLEKRFNNASELIKQLLNLGIIKQIKKSEYIEIKFLNEQYDILSERRKRRQKAGSKGGKQKSSNAKAKLKQSSSYKDKYKDKENNNYKNNLLSKIKISDLTEKQKEYYEIAISFYKLFEKNLIDAGANLHNLEKAKGTWIDDIRLLIENDKYTIEQLRNVFNFLQKDQFWKKNILSTNKLRQQFDKLLLNINENGQNKKGASEQELAETIFKHFGNKGN